MTASWRQECSERIAEPATTKATIRPRAASQPGASARNAPTAGQPPPRSHETTDRHGHARSDQLSMNDAETSPTRPIKIDLQVAGRSDNDTSAAIFATMRRPQRRITRASALTAAGLAIVLAGCGQQTTGTSALTASGASTPSTSSTTTREVSTTTASPGRRPAHGGKQTAGGLAYSTASAQTVQAQPPRASTHARIRTAPPARLTPRSPRPPSSRPPAGTAGPTPCGRRRASPSQRSRPAWPPTATRDPPAPTSTTTSSRWSSAAPSMTLGTCGQSPVPRPTQRTPSRTNSTGRCVTASSPSPRPSGQSRPTG